MMKSINGFYNNWYSQTLLIQFCLFFFRTTLQPCRGPTKQPVVTRRYQSRRHHHHQWWEALDQSSPSKPLLSWIPGTKTTYTTHTLLVQTSSALPLEPDSKKNRSRNGLPTNATDDDMSGHTTRSRRHSPRSSLFTVYSNCLCVICFKCYLLLIVICCFWCTIK